MTPHLRTKDNRPVTLQFREANTKMVFEVLSRQTGINFIFDKDVKADGKTTIFVQSVSVDQAIALILGQNQLGQQVLAENMVLIYPNNGAKQKEYQDNIVRTFYLTNADPKKVMESLKTVLGSKTVSIDERINVLMMRDTPEAVRMAERMIASLDVPEAEVMLEVEVLELTRTRLQQLGIKYPTSVTLSPTPLAGDPLVLRDLRDQDDTTITVSNLPLTIDLKKSVGTTNVLASPRIRARNKEKSEDPDRSARARDYQQRHADQYRTCRHRQRAVSGRRLDAGSRAYCVSGRRCGHQGRYGGQLHYQPGHRRYVGNARLSNRHTQRQYRTASEGL